MDTFAGSNTDPITLNKYLYANVNPANMVDPSGEFSIGSIVSAINNLARLSRAATSTALKLVARSSVKNGKVLRGLSLRSRFWLRLTQRKVQKKLPEKGWGKPTLNKKSSQSGRAEKPGMRWNRGKGDSVRIDRGDSKSPNPSQRVDHVRITSDGRLLGRSGKRLPPGSRVKDHGWDTHIPLKDWLRWRNWNQP